MAAAVERLEAHVGQEEQDLVIRVEPARIRLGISGVLRGIRHDGDGVHEVQRAVGLEASGAQRTLVNTEGEASVSGGGFPGVAGQGEFPLLVTTRDVGLKDVLHARLGAEQLNLVRRRDDAEVRAALVASVEHLGEQVLLDVCARCVEIDSSEAVLLVLATAKIELQRGDNFGFSGFLGFYHS